MLMYTECLYADVMLRDYVRSVNSKCKITVVADCCHSGGLIEGLKIQVGDDEWLSLANKQGIIKQVDEKRRELAHAVLLSACRSKEKAFFYKKGKKGSLFTYYWTRVVRRFNGRISHGEMIRRVNVKLASLQNACLFCDDNRVEELFLGGAFQNHL
jgi:hypothetical protein